ncbi:hypothetical protein BDZ89DRAFT_735071 [Hymenopellis radicata]|nr:hypothetical protein BDZ89DRAFT_735071 [Hymenopellis radicata]
MENPLVSDAYTTHTFGSFTSPPPGPDLASEFEPSREWRDGLFKRVQDTYVDMVAEAKRHLEDCLAADGLTNDHLHDPRYKNHIAEYQDRKENAKKISQQAYNDQLQRERFERRWGAGLTMPRSWTEDVGAEQQAIMDNIARKRTASESGSIKDPPPVQVTEAVKEPEKSDIDEEEEDQEEAEDDEEDVQGPTAVSNSPSTSQPISIPTTYKRSSYGPTRSPEVWMPPPIAVEEAKRERERERERESLSRRGSITSRRGSINSVRSKPSTNNVREKAATDDPGLRPKASINFRPPSVPVPIPELHDDDEDSYSSSKGKGKGKAPEVPEAFNWERTAKEPWRNDPDILPRSTAAFTTPVTPIKRSSSPDDSESESSSGSEEVKRKSAERAWLSHGRSRGREKQPMSTRSQFSSQSVSRRASFLSSPSPPASATMSQAQGPPPPPPLSTKPNPSLLSQSRPMPSSSAVQSPMSAVSSSPVATYASHPPTLAHVAQGVHSHPVYMPANSNARLPERTQSLHKPSNHEPSSLSRHHTLPPEIPRFPDVGRLFVNQEPDSTTDDESESEAEPPVVRRRRSRRTPEDSPSPYTQKPSHKSSRPQSIGIPRSQTVPSVGASLHPSNYLPTSAAAFQTPSRRPPRIITKHQLYRLLHISRLHQRRIYLAHSFPLHLRLFRRSLLIITRGSNGLSRIKNHCPKLITRRAKQRLS